MHKFILVIAFLISSIFSPVYADELDQAKIEAINELFDTTEMEIQFLTAFGPAMSRGFRTAVKARRPNISERTLEIIESEVMSVVEDELIEKDGLRILFYPIYHKYFSTAEIQQITEYNKTPVGKKAVDALPLIAREGQQNAVALLDSLKPILIEAIRARLKKEKIDPVL